MVERNDESRDMQLPVVVIGAGGHARVLLDLLRCLGRQVLFMTDRDVQSHGRRVGEVEVRGDDDLIYDLPPASVRLVNGVGSTAQPRARREVYSRFTERGYRFDTLIHPSAVVAANVQLDSGVQVMAGVVIQPGTRVGKNTLLNTRASIDHDCRIGDHVHVAPGVTLSGSVSIGALTHIGTGATAIHGVRIGAEALIGAGAVVVNDISDGAKVTGVPARAHRSRHDRAASAETVTIMLSAAGRRVALLRMLRESGEVVGLQPRLLATDITQVSAAMHLADVARCVPRYRDPDCLEQILRLCRKMSVRLIVPTIDPDLPFYAEHRAAFEAIGTQIAVSSAETIRIGNDKLATHQWLTERGLPTVRQADAAVVLENPAAWTYPLFAKPRRGSSSIGAMVVKDAAALDILAREQDYIVQEIAPGREYTVDVYVDREGVCRCAVPRLRIETRGGEVVKGMTARIPAVQAVAKRVAEALPGAWGVLNIQVFYDEASGAVNVIEINPRFGGGYPLTHAAGAPMTRWLLEEATGLPCTARDDQWTDGLVMLRYDEAVFVDREKAGV